MSQIFETTYFIQSVIFAQIICTIVSVANSQQQTFYFSTQIFKRLIGQLDSKLFYLTQKLHQADLFHYDLKWMYE